MSSLLQSLPESLSNSEQTEGAAPLSGLWVRQQPEADTEVASFTALSGEPSASASGLH